ncbi:MAG: hypothetical protein QM236_00865, partial [Bacillota bacterium]|nr:hypothetical protein [Bacillota bacterium]
MTNQQKTTMLHCIIKTLHQLFFCFRIEVDHDLWEKQGFIKTTDGNVVHYGFIENFIEELGMDYNIREIAFDRWGAVQMT